MPVFSLASSVALPLVICSTAQGNALSVWAVYVAEVQRLMAHGDLGLDRKDRE